MTPMAYLYICDGDIDHPVLTHKKMDWPEKYPHWQEIPLVMAQPEQELLAWKNAALRVGEDLSSVGPKGYYNMTAQQWLDWAMAQQPRGNNSLAQPEQGPVGWFGYDQSASIWFETNKGEDNSVPLYTTPPQRTWVGLTKNELQPICNEYRIIFGSWVEDFAKAIEAKLKEKNHG